MNTTNTEKKPRKARRIVSAREKAQAILAVWSGHRSASQVCRELDVNWGSLNGWERKGVQGILKALGGEATSLPTQGPLGRRLESLLTTLSVLPGNPPETPPEATGTKTVLV